MQTLDREQSHPTRGNIGTRKNSYEWAVKRNLDTRRGFLSNMDKVLVQQYSKHE